ncbi:WRC [Macleaya cordata]|uniref:Growth-regulating factor n=1 Tax=Macleaya cordata TaxID=56857 RepID=A0A200QG27_MACCD|nr:WRC [Macleaya cordata]
MDFGMVGLDGFVGSESGFTSSMDSEAENRQKGYGSRVLKQARSSGSADDEWRSLKMAKTDDVLASNKMQLQQRTSSLLRSNSLTSDGQQMLSFSSPKSDTPLYSSNTTLPFYHHTLSSYARNTGLGSGSSNTSMSGVLTGFRGAFTSAQWMELEHQALIYKYITSNMPIPSNLLIPIRKAFERSGYSPFAGSLRPNILGWGSFHMGFSGNTDPEPGRCRRTDGKKWRCSRDVVADQKYCERHLNRGRHRSRKPVEGQIGRAASGSTTKKVMPMSSSSASVVSRNGASNNLTIRQQQATSLQPGVANISSNYHISRVISNKENEGGPLQDSQVISMLSPSVNLKPKDNPFEQFSQTKFGCISSDSVMTTSQRSSFIDCRNFSSSTDPSDRESRVQDPLRHFIDDWPKNKHDQTQLSISIPISSSEFSSSSSSPIHEKDTFSPLRLSREYNPIHMGLGVSNVLDEPTRRQANWIPISWETSMGGPLGEVLNHTSLTSGDCMNSSSALNLMTEGWDVSPQMDSSPTGVLQKSTFGSLSNGSTCSSPRTETNKTQDGASFCDNLLGSPLVNSFPSL